MVDLSKRSLLTLLDFSAEEIGYLLELAVRLKNDKYTGREGRRCRARTSCCCSRRNDPYAMLFRSGRLRSGRAERPIRADRLSGRQEGVHQDTARVLGTHARRWIEYRGFAQRIVHTLAEYSGVPVWNGLTNEFHPDAQALADMMVTGASIHRSRSRNGKSVFLGDAHNNVANSLMVASALDGDGLPGGLARRVRSRRFAGKAVPDAGRAERRKIAVTDDLVAGVDGCDFVYTDVWVSMGEPDEMWQRRIDLLRPYQVNGAVMEATHNPGSQIHALPSGVSQSGNQGR